MNNSHKNRNAAIIQQHQSGKRLRDIAGDFRISPGRVQQIVKNADRDARRRSELERKYGFRPEIAALPDSTPLEVLLLCNAKIQGKHPVSPRGVGRPCAGLRAPPAL